MLTVIHDVLGDEAHQVRQRFLVIGRHFNAYVVQYIPCSMHAFVGYCIVARLDKHHARTAIITLDKGKAIIVPVLFVLREIPVVRFNVEVHTNRLIVQRYL